MLELNKIYCGDCLELMKQLPDKSIDLVVTSPPYNTGNNSLGYHPNSTTGDNFYDEYQDNKDTKEYARFLVEVIKECLRVSRYVFWNMQILSGNKEVVFGIISQFKDNFKDMFIWEKQAVSQIVKGRMAKGYELVLCFGQDNNMTFNYNNFPENGYVPNIKNWFKKGNEATPEHHATFPQELPKYFIQNFSKNDDKILDPFNGIGSTCLAAKQLKRNFIGIEISQKYCDIANQRLRQNILI